MEQVIVSGAPPITTASTAGTATTSVRGPVLRDPTRRLPMAAVASSGLVLLLVEAALLAETAVVDYPVSVLLPAVGMLNVAVGCLAWRRRPSNRTGAVLVLGGMIMMVAALINSNLPLVSAIGAITAGLVIPVLMHMLMVFPSGRLHGRFMIIAAVMYVVSMVLAAPGYLFAGSGEPYSILMIESRPAIAATAGRIQTVVGVVLIIGCVVLVLHRLRRLDAGRRRAVRGLIAYWAACLLWLPLTANVLIHVFDLSPVTLYVWQVVALAGIPIMFGRAVLRGGFARMRDVEDLSRWLAIDRSHRPGLDELLARHLGDVSVRVWFATADGTHVDSEGRVRLAPLPADRGQVSVDGAGHIGLIEYDRLLLVDPTPVVAAARLVAVEMDRDRLTAELVAHQVALESSRGRLVHTADRERRRIAHDLHDGLQPRLVLLGVALHRTTRLAPPEVRDELVALQRELDATALEVRRLVHGIMPPPLVEQGLVSAVVDLVDRTAVAVTLDLPRHPTGLAPAAEAAGYFFVAESLTNVIKHAHAEHVTVAIRLKPELVTISVSDDGVGGVAAGRGLGLSGCRDRAEALGGRLVVHSRPGTTTVTMELPCVS